MRKITTPLKGLLLGSLALAMLAMSSGCTKMRTRLEYEKLESIHDKFATGWIDGARQDITGFLEMHERNATAWVIRGNILSNSDAYWEALYAYQRALLLDDGIAAAHRGLGVLFSQNEEFDRAIIHYEKSLDLDSYDAQTMTSLSVTYLKTQQFKKAMEWGERAYETDGEDALIMAHLCLVYHFNGEYAKREQLYSKAKRYGYDGMDGVDKIIRGELRIFPEETEAEQKVLAGVEE